MADYTALLEAGREAVLLASSVTRQVQGAIEQVRAITKEDDSPVSVADYAAQAIVGRVLADRLGGDVILVGEEDSSYLSDDTHAAVLDAVLAAVREIDESINEDQLLRAIDVGAGDTHHAGFWTLDPIDGTKGFLRGQQYSIALAYIERGEPVVAALACPNLAIGFDHDVSQVDAEGSLYVAIKGDGAWESRCTPDAASAPTQLQRLDHDEGEAITVCTSVEAKHSNIARTNTLMDEVAEPWDRLPIDSQCKYAVVARGQADAYVRMPVRKTYIERIWDHAAGALIATEAGAGVSDMFGRPLDFGHGRGLEQNQGLIVAAPRVHAKLHAAMESLGYGRD
ncbi:MAG: 3'(2'),5'-bisphosphate nucleotidase [Planctomycetota bacterium]